jgi:hypothetical protein
VDGRLKTSDLLADGFIWWSGTLPDAGAGDFFAEITAETGACSARMPPDSPGVSVG